MKFPPLGSLLYMGGRVTIVKIRKMKNSSNMLFVRMSCSLSSNVLNIQAEFSDFWCLFGSACNASLRTSKLEKFNSIDAVELAICALEDDPCLNAGKKESITDWMSLLNLVSSGTGSNLTYDGSVECDASIVDGEDQKFGSVGALRGYYIYYFKTL